MKQTAAIQVSIALDRGEAGKNIVFNQFIPVDLPAMPVAANLEDVSDEQLMEEVRRRLQDPHGPNDLDVDPENGGA